MKIVVNNDFLTKQKIDSYSSFIDLKLTGIMKLDWPIIRKKFKIVLVTWGGRRRYLNILLPYILQLRQYTDEWRIFSNTDWQPDIDYIKNIEYKYLKLNFINVVNKRVIKDDINCFNQYYEDLNEKDTIYIKIDDDITFIDTKKFKEFIYFRIKNPSYLFVFANIINCTALYNEQKEKINNKEIKKWKNFNPWVYDNDFDKRTNLLAKYIHESFLKSYTSKKWFIKNRELDPINKNDRISLNFACWFGNFFNINVPEIEPNTEDEIFFNTILPNKIQIKNIIFGEFVVSHYSYSTQTEYLDKELILKSYRDLRNKLFKLKTTKEENINQEDGCFKSLNRSQNYIYVNSNAPRKKAIFTIVKNEDKFLKLWINYYKQHFNYEDIYVLDHNSTDGSTENLPCWRLKVNHDYSYDFDFLTKTAQEFQYELLKTYKNVIYTDVDEFLILTNKYKNFDDYFSKFKLDYTRVTGYEIFHNNTLEPKLNWDEPIFNQRSYWFKKQLYDKPIISTVPLQWGWGFHDVYNKKYQKDEDVILIHLHRVDYEYCKEKHKKTAAYKWNEKQVTKHPTAGWHLRITGNKEFDNYYYGQLENTGPIEKIPDWLKGRL